MTPKEKAEDLVLWYLNLQEPNYNWFHKSLAKKCALKAVDEIIECSVSYNRHNATWASQENYWKEVKQEIEKL
jgi:hypothetical protein